MPFPPPPQPPGTPALSQFSGCHSEPLPPLSVFLCLSVSGFLALSARPTPASDSNGPPHGPQEDKLRLVQELSDLVIYCKSVHFGGFSSSGTSGQAFYEMASFSENRALRMLQESGESLCRQRGPAICLTIWAGQGQAWLLLLRTRVGAACSITRENLQGAPRVPREASAADQTTPPPRKQLCPPQRGALEQDLPRGLENRLLQLQPRGDVERGLPDWYGPAGAGGHLGEGFSPEGQGPRALNAPQ